MPGGRPARTVMSMSHPSASFSAVLRVHLDNHPGAFAQLAAAIGEAGGLLGAIDLVRVHKQTKVRDVTVQANDAEHIDRIVEAVRELPGIEIEHVSDRTFLLHLGGKLEVQPRTPLKTRDDLSMAYTPGVARICRAIVDEPDNVWRLTIKQNAVAVVTDGTAVLGLGDIGPAAALPVMEGKAVLFKEFAEIDAWPVCLAMTDPDEIVAAVRAIAPVFGGINLEDIAAPRCFEIEERLKASLDIPIFHDDQHGTAVVVMAALFNALKIVGKPIESLRVLMVGLGAAGVAVTKMMLESGVTHVVGCDRSGAISTERDDYKAGGMSDIKRWYAEVSNPEVLIGDPADVIEGMDLFIGLSGPGIIPAQALEKMNDDAIVFAMANPNPEVMPEEAEPYVRIMATGRSDYPNQINNVLCFPGIFRGALDAGAPSITEEMKLAAAHGIANVVTEEDLSEDYIIPSVFNRDVAPAVAEAVVEEAKRDGIARFNPETGSFATVDV
jgi:malate dehydrogenase (oxaloacetate-decarboxylating)